MKRICILIMILILIITSLIIVKIIEYKNEKIMRIEAEKKIKIKEEEIKIQKIEKKIQETCEQNKRNIYNKIKEIKMDKNVLIKNGVVFKNKKALMLLPTEVIAAYMSRKSIEQSNEEYLKAVELFFSDAMILHITDSYKNNPYFTLPETEKCLCYKIEGYNLYLRDPLEKDVKWEPVKIRFIKELKPDPDREHAQYPCMLVYLETKWFKGEYELECE